MSTNILFVIKQNLYNTNIKKKKKNLKFHVMDDLANLAISS